MKINFNKVKLVLRVLGAICLLLFLIFSAFKFESVASAGFLY